MRLPLNKTLFLLYNTISTYVHLVTQWRQWWPGGGSGSLVEAVIAQWGQW